MAGVGGTPERGAALRIGGMDICTALDKQSYDREMTRVGRQEQRRHLSTPIAPGSDWRRPPGGASSRRRDHERQPRPKAISGTDHNIPSASAARHSPMHSLRWTRRIRSPMTGNIRHPTVMRWQKVRQPSFAIDTPRAIQTSTSSAIEISPPLAGVAQLVRCCRATRSSATACDRSVGPLRGTLMK
jgi:hypothetical protein